VSPKHTLVIQKHNRELAVADKHLTIQDLAERVGVPVATVYQWNTKGTAPRYLRIGRHVRYRLADVITWENERCVVGEPRAG
jgi:excisionase family DNA binding protein